MRLFGASAFMQIIGFTTCRIEEADKAPWRRHLRRLPVYALMQARKEHKKGAVKLRNDNPELHSPRFPSFGIPRACARMVLKNQLRVAAEGGLFQRDFDVRLVRPEVQGRRSRSV